MDATRGPVFIGGLSSSGKTELRIALGAHPALELTRHTDMWGRFLGRFGDLAHPRNLDRCLAAMMADERVRALQPDAERIRREFVEGPRSYARLFGLFHEHHAERAGKRRWGEQLAFVERYAAPIFEAFPTARMIHLIRDPRAWWRADAGSRRRPGSVGWETARWLRSADLAERNQRRYGFRYLALQYETLAADPLDTVRDVCAFLDEVCGRDVEDAVASMRFDEAGIRGDRRDERTRAIAEAFVSRYALRRNPRFEYQPTSVALTPRLRLSSLLVHRPVDRAAMAAWRLLDGRGPTKVKA